MKWRRQPKSAVVGNAVSVGDWVKNAGILGVGVGIVGILGPGHKLRMHQARMCLEQGARHNRPARIAHRYRGQEEEGRRMLLVCQSTRLEVLVVEEPHMIGR